MSDSESQIPKDLRPGLVVLFGSGETSPSGRKAFEHVFRQLGRKPKVSLLETPAGFELNSSRVIGRVDEFLQTKLQNYQPQISVIPARARGTMFSPDAPEVVAPMLEADLIFMGPGSPTYAVRQLENSLAWQMILARHRLGGVLVLASAAAIAVSSYALPVYEIFKVGEELHWKKGLDLFGYYGLPLVFIPHWNNNDGGQELDTSRCFIGQPRLAKLLPLLPPDLTVIGIDEKTALVIDIEAGLSEVIGLGGVTILQGGDARFIANGNSFPLTECCPFEIPISFAGISPHVWKQALQARERLVAEIKHPARQPESIPAEIQQIADSREGARQRKDWSSADAFREQLAALGWSVIDLPEGNQLLRKKEE